MNVEVPVFNPATELLTPGDAALYTRYSIRTIRRWRAAGWLQSVGLVDRPRYRREDVDAVLYALADRDPPDPEAKSR